MISVLATACGGDRRVPPLLARPVEVTIATLDRDARPTVADACPPGAWRTDTERCVLLEGERSRLQNEAAFRRDRLFHRFLAVSRRYQVSLWRRGDVVAVAVLAMLDVGVAADFATRAARSAALSDLELMKETGLDALDERVFAERIEAYLARYRAGGRAIPDRP
jgi:hypothetical protein